ncbi:NADPH-dependent diflavin oxidoreductase 1 [Manduca sexta]|uniref:NADPH-dependent diflavin oxidoreductase 1 n=1 Tax=Manduca sexta TaxID=7130 RepID=A0A921ZE60_MANSE|nr:NADPH-dependent diflavin oxidoreductase 1 [Manduca sexta]KAG6455741.1 hypothetical protein O3G_MSEX009361 [Manduca sexta]
MIVSKRLLVLYGSQTFTGQEIAERIWRMTKALGFRGPVLAMDDYPISQLIHEEYVIFVCSTTGRGVEPDNMGHFWKFLLRANLPSNSLVKLKYGVLGLGDSSYAQFNFAGKKLHRRLKQLGATPLLDIGLCDYQHDLGHDGVMSPWVKEFFNILKRYFPELDLNINSDFVPRWKVSLLRDVEPEKKISDYPDIYFAKGNESVVKAVPLKITSNERTTDTSHFQDVRLIKLRSDAADMNYKPGDVFNIRPRNSKEDIDDLFGIFETHKLDILPHHRLLVEEYHDDMPVPDYLKPPLTLYEIAEQYWDLRCYPSQYVFSLLAIVSEDKLEKEKCLELSSPEGQEEWLNYCRRPKRTALEVLHDFHKSASKLTIEILFELFPTIKPRSFSIASSALPSNGHDIDLLVAVVEYRTKLKKPRLGLASNWLKDLKIGSLVYGWIKPGTFMFPGNDTPYIMVGPGTGLAPFRSVLQERITLDQATSDSMHLFFGCRYHDKDFHCKEELEGMVDTGKLSLYTAFSRDQDNKVYVQHRIKEHAEELWRILNSENGYIFLSGSSKSMPDNVRDAFIEEVLCKHGGLSLDEAKQRMKELENKRRYQTETW